MKASIVVGSGLTGCMLARCLIERGGRVILIDAATTPGGLLGSAAGPRGLPVDYGAHYVLDTGPQRLVDYTLEVMREEDWVKFTGNLPEESFYRGVLDRESGCLDATLLEEDRLWQGVRETLERVETKTDGAETLEQVLLQRLGPTITTDVYAPLMKKIFGTQLADLGPSAMKTIVPMRIRLFERELAKALKTIPKLDDVLAYAKRWDHPSDIAKYYPRRGGVGRWVTDFLDRLRDLGVEVRLGESVAGFEFEGKRISSCRLTGGETVSVESLYWTGSSAAVAKSLSVPLSTDTPPPVFRDLFLVHFAYRGEAATTAHYIYNYDPELLPYRVTLYSNISDEIRSNDVVHGTAECLIAPTDEDPIPQAVTDAVRAMGLFEKPIEILETTTYRRPRAMIVPDRFLYDRAARLSEAIQSRCENCVLVGTARAPMFGQTAILDDVASVLELQA